MLNMPCPKRMESDVHPSIGSAVRDRAPFSRRNLRQLRGTELGNTPVSAGNTNRAEIEPRSGDIYVAQRVSAGNTNRAEIEPRSGGICRRSAARLLVSLASPGL